MIFSLCRLSYYYYKDILSTSTPMQSGVLPGDSETEIMVLPMRCLALHLSLVPMSAHKQTHIDLSSMWLLKGDPLV